MSLQERLADDMKAALKAGDALKLSAIRLLRSRLQNMEIDKGAPLTDDEVVQGVAKEAKQRREAIEQFQKAGRTDLVEKETAELQVLSQYLPGQLGEAEIAGIAQEMISELQATSKADKGRVMNALMQRLCGRADGRLVNQIVGRLLEGGSV